MKTSKKKKILKIKKINKDDSYGEEPVMRALGDSGHPSERDWY